MMQTTLSNAPSRRIPTRAGALHSAAGALLVIAAFFALPLYMTAFLGSSSYSATAWVTSNTIASAYTFAIQTSPPGLGTLLGTLIVPLALLWLPLACACVVLLKSFAGIIAPLPRALVQTACPPRIPAADSGARSSCSLTAGHAPPLAPRLSREHDPLGHSFPERKGEW
jgi:hypothetical protein